MVREGHNGDSENTRDRDSLWPKPPHNTASNQTPYDIEGSCPRVDSPGLDGAHAIDLLQKADTVDVEAHLGCGGKHYTSQAPNGAVVPSDQPEAIEDTIASTPCFGFGQQKRSGQESY